MLVNHRDALAPGVSRAEDRDLLPVLKNSPAVRLMNAAKDLDQRALPGPVLAGERMHPPAVKAEIDVTQNLDGSKALRDPAKFNYRSH